MRHHHRFPLLLPIALVASVAVLCAGVEAQTATLAPPAERITDGAIQRDHLAYERVQARIRALNDGGRRASDEHLAKAQCWLDASFHEYTRNDRSAFPQAALAESDRLVTALEQKASPLPTDTPLVDDAPRLRPDLWEKTRALRAGPGFTCAAAKAACAEVALVHAGHEHAQQGWRHAKPYVQMAEDAVGDAEADAATCKRPAAPAAR